MHQDAARRQDWLGLMARAPSSAVKSLWEQCGREAPFAWLRRPETGSVMVRGRAGATGDAFNLGEMTVTRCSVRLESGAVGHGYCQGRDALHAQIAALADALLQGPDADAVRRGFLDPLRDRENREIGSLASKAEATKVDFFTLVRGED